MLKAVDFDGYAKSVKEALDCGKFDEKIKANDKRIVIKPNLISTQEHPITVHVECVASIVRYIKEHIEDAEIIIAEGAGGCETDEAFRALGYEALAEEEGVRLVDLNQDEVETLKKQNALAWKEFYCPKTLIDAFVVNVPVLKRHSMAGVTLAMKNLIGACPAPYYQSSGHWKKSKTHSRLHEVIYDLNLYIKSDFVVLDATIGMAEAHLWGEHCNPPVNKILVSDDVVEHDKEASRLLGVDWKKIQHIKLASDKGL